MDQADEIVEEPIEGVVESETPPEQPADDGELEITIEGESPPPEESEFHGKPAPDWVKELRKSDREKAKRIRELEQAAEANKRPAAPDVLGPKPTLAASDYDEAKFDADLSTWHEKKRVHDEKEASITRTREAEQAAWQAKLNNYGQAKAKLRVPDFQEAEDTALEHLSQVQQGVILNGSDEPEKTVYVLGKNPMKLKELAAITDPVKFAFAVAKLETQVKATPRKAPPAPETPVRGNASASAVDSTEAKLLAQAEKTGDMTAYRQYRSEKRKRS